MGGEISDGDCGFCKLLQAEIAVQAAELERLREKVTSLESRLKKENFQDACVQTEESSAGAFCGDVAKMAAEVAEEVIASQSGFVFDPESGYYYDSTSGLYYDGNKELYYDPKTMVFFRYNAETGENEFVSKADPPKSSDKTDDGDELAGEKSTMEGVDDSEEEIVNSWPPCMRLVVESTSSSDIRLGSVFIIIHPGGIIGRDSDCDVALDDEGIAPRHVEIKFNEDLGHYQASVLSDCDPVEISGQTVDSDTDPITVGHWSSIKLGSTKLACHVHTGNETCNSCEPGLTISASSTSADNAPKYLSKEEREKERRKTVKAIKKKYGVENVQGAAKLMGDYKDRAEERRVTKGVDDLYAKPVEASVDQPIPSSNVGRKMMEKMGWKQGESLGAGDDGIVEPVAMDGARMANDRAGLGTSTFPEAPPPRKKKTIPLDQL